MVAPPTRTDVLIVGAGPSGLMAAQALARLGVDVRVIEKRHPDSLYGNADGLQPHTLAIWQSYGLLEKITPIAASVHGMVTYEQSKNGGLIRSKPGDNMVVDCRYPFELAIGIKYIEGTLRNSAIEAGATIMQPVSPISFEIAPDTGRENLSYPVKVKVQYLSSSNEMSKRPSTQGSHAADTEVIYAKYMIGADGAHSFLRKHLGIKMEGESTEYVWGVADVTVDTDFPDCRLKCIIQSARGAVIVIPREYERIRIYVQLSLEDCILSPDGQLDKAALSPEYVQKIVLQRAKEGLRPYTFEFTNVFWATIFSVPHRVAERFSEHDRVFISGDACHTHSPKAGQGANASMGDAHNLAWKIAYVLRGWADKSLLDTYEAERRQYALDLIAFDKEISASLDGKTAAEYQAMLHKQNLFSSGIGICYHSRLTYPNNINIPHLAPGERMPTIPLVRLGDWKPMELQDLFPSNGLFKLFLFAQDILVPERKYDLEAFEDVLRTDGFAAPDESDSNKEVSIIRDASTSWGGKDISGMMAIHTILTSCKQDVHWKDVPSSLQCWKRVFILEDTSAKFGIADKGFVVLVRPDGYISMITDISEKGARRIVKFVQSL